MRKNEINPILHNWLKFIELAQFIEIDQEIRTMDRSYELKIISALNRSTYNNTIDKYIGKHQSKKSLPQHEKDAKDILEQVTKKSIGQLEYIEIGPGIGAFTTVFLKQAKEKNIEIRTADLFEISNKMCKYICDSADTGINDTIHVCNKDFILDPPAQVYNVIIAMAFIHLYPKAHTEYILNLIFSKLSTPGIAYISTTIAEGSTEGLKPKNTDPDREEIRYRSEFTQDEFKHYIESSKFRKNYYGPRKSVDPYKGYRKEWMSFILYK